MIKTLNGLRTFLFLFIFGTHFKYTIIYSEIGKSLFDFFNIGRFAILFFVVLSGFCMSLGYSDKFKTVSKGNYISYLKKRFIKLYPLYLISGFIGLLFIYIKQGIHWLYLFIFVYVPMLTTWLGINAGGNIAAWFICVIFFCYIITPPAIYLFNKKSDLNFHMWFCFINYLILVIFSLILVLQNDPNNEYFYRFPVIRVFEYLVALDVGFIFVNLLKNKIDFKIFNNYFSKSIIDFVFISVFLLIMYVCPNNLLYRHFLGLPLMCIFLVYLCIEKRSILHDILSSKLCNFIGNISFECYLIHLLVMQMCSHFSRQFIYTFHGIILLYIIFLSITIGIALIYNRTEKFVKSKLMSKQ